jgi:hypothetical protein
MLLRCARSEPLFVTSCVNDQMMLFINRHLHVLADHPGTAPARRHRTIIGIRPQHHELCADLLTAEHLTRSAYVYIRQSTADQLAHNHGSRQRQYALADRARQLGWTSVEIVDDDLGRSGSGTVRPGFDRLIGRSAQARSVPCSRSRLRVSPAMAATGTC